MKNKTTNKVVIKNSLRGGFRKTLWRIFIVLGIAALVVIGILMILNPNGFGDVFWGVVLIIGGGFGGYFIVESMINGTVIATISDKGIDVTDKAFIPWEHVKSFKKEIDGIVTQAISGPGSSIDIVYYENGDVEKLRSVSFDSEYSPYTNEGIVKILEEFYEGYKSESSRVLPGRDE